MSLRDRLRSCDVWVEGSRAFRAFDDFLLPRAAFENRRGWRIGARRSRWLWGMARHEDEQMVLSEFMLRGLFISHIWRMRSLYRARQIELIEGLDEIFGEKLPLAGLETGVHLTLRLADHADDRKLTCVAAEHGVVVRPLSPCYSAQRRKQGLLLGVAAFNAAEIHRGLARKKTFKNQMIACLRA